MTVEVLVNHQQFIHSKVTSPSGAVFCFFTAVYGSPIPSLRDKLWYDLQNLQIDADTPWLVAGDFNATVSEEERSGGARRLRTGDRGFLEFMLHSGTIDLGYVGPKYTWQRGHLLVRLDRALSNLKWIDVFPNARVLHLPKIQSDHRPLLIQTNGEKTSNVRPFKFLASWLLHPNFHDMVKAAWDDEKNLASNIENFTTRVKEWNRTVFGHVGQQKRKLEARLRGIQKALERPHPPDTLILLEKELIEEYENICLREEMLWMQKARAQWINDGDRNTKYYHTKALLHRRRNNISMLKDDNGMWESDQSKLQELAQQYFQSLYSTEGASQIGYRVPGSFPHLPSHHVSALKRAITKEEVKASLFEMHPLKSPGPDGLHALFFQSQWNVVGGSIFREMQRIFEGGDINPSFNRTLIALIPKVDQPQTIKEFRPISLCTTMYKLVTKIIAGRLKEAMPFLALPQQTSFIKGRSITDNIIIAQEVIHTMRLKQGKKGYMAIKVDLEKAFDRLRWDFIEHTLLEARIPHEIVSIIMKCITTPTMQVIWNGQPSQSFQPGRGIRQGDPLSPYIFVLCMERLSQAINLEVSKGSWEPIKMGPHGPLLSHLFFADDLLLFSSTESKQIRLMSKLIQGFCEASGQKVSAAKTRVYFSKNVSTQLACTICTQMGFQKTDNLGRYLGVPLLHGRVLNDTYRHLVEKVKGKLSGWTASSLSLAGRLTLAQAVLSAIPYYSMQTTRLPSCITHELQRHVQSFIWNSNGSKKGVHLMKWEDLCCPKSHGGCGMKDFQAQNSAFLMKLAYRLRTEPDQLWVKVLSCKYNWSATAHARLTKKARCSYMWRSLASLWADLDVGTKWSMGDGTTTRFWADHWLEDRGPLYLLADKPLTDEELNLPLQHFIGRAGGWDVTKFHNILPSDIVEDIVRTITPHMTDPPAQCTWTMDNRGFSVSSAYRLLQEDLWPEHNVNWQLAWKWRGPQRIRTFLWLTLSNKLLTNKERCRRHMTLNANCVFCGDKIEDLEHVLRSCRLAKECWKLILPEGKLDTFFSLPFLHWLNVNLRQGNNRPEWSTLFGILCWKFWKARNDRIFEHKHVQPYKLIMEALFLFESISKATDATCLLNLH